MKYLLVFFTGVVLASCSPDVKDGKGIQSDSVPAADPGTLGSKSDTMMAPPQAPATNENSVFEVKPFDNSRNVAGTNFNGWGYDIYIDGKLTIRQPNIPAIPGNNGFKTEAQAKTVGEFMANKIRHNIMPPTVDKKELASMGVDTIYKK